MDALGGLEEIAEQTASSINPGAKTKRANSGWGISPNLERSKVAREKKAPPPAVKKPTPPPPSPSRAPARLGKAITTYRMLIETFRERAVELELSRSELDRITGLTSGYSGKLLSLGTAKELKRLGPISLDNMLGALGLSIVLIEDPIATARTLALRQPVDQRNQRFGNVCRRGGELTTLKNSAPPLG